MAYSEIPSAWLDIGDPVKKELFDQVNDNLIDHESRVNTLEGGINKIVIWNDIVRNAAQIISSSTIEGLDYWQAPASFTLTSAIVTAFVAGSSGSTQIDIQKSTTFDGVYTTVFSTKPSVAFGDAPAESTNAIFSSTSVAAGDWLRLDISAFQVPQGKFQIYAIGELS